MKAKWPTQGRHTDRQCLGELIEQSYSKFDVFNIERLPLSQGPTDSLMNCTQQQLSILLLHTQRDTVKGKSAYSSLWINP